MSAFEEINFLKNVPILKDLTDEQIKFVHDVMNILEIGKDKTVFKEGEEGDEMYIIYQGTVEISQSLTLKLGRIDFASKEKTLTKLSEKDHAFFGEMALLERNVRTATVTTLTPCKFFTIKREDWEKIGEEKPEIGYKILTNIAKVLCSRLRKANEDVLKLTTALSMALSK